MAPSYKHMGRSYFLRMTNMTLTQFFDYVNAFSGERPPHQRLGQWAFNLLYEGYPDIANDIRGGEADPFHADSRMPLFLQAILEYVKA